MKHMEYQVMEMEDTPHSAFTSESADEEELDLDEYLRLEEGFKAPHWSERVEAARSAASTLVKDRCLRRLSSKEVLSFGASQVHQVYHKLLRQLLQELALKDWSWQVRVAAVESATTILAAAKTVLPVHTFAEYVWVLLAVCLDDHPEVKETACNSILQRLSISSSNESLVIVLQLCDHFFEAAIAADSLPLKFSKLSTKSRLTGLDNLPNGEMLLAGITAAICLQLLPVPVSDGARRQKSLEPDRIPLLLVVVVVALNDAKKRQSRVIARGLSRLLRSLGKPFYRQSLVTMFNVKGPFYFSGPDLARTYHNAGIINEDTADVVKTIATVTIVEGLSRAFGVHTECAGYLDDFLLPLDDHWADDIISKYGSVSKPSSRSGLSEGDIIALRHIVEVLQIPEDLTKTLNGVDMDSKAFQFAKSAMPLLGISISIIKKNCVPRDPLLPDKIFEDLLLCCATFAGGDGEYGGTSMWTSKDLRELSMTLLTCLSNVVHPVGTKVSSSDGLKTETDLVLLETRDTNLTPVISGQIASLLPRLKQIIQESTRSPGNDEILLKCSPERTLGSSIIAANQMRWILGQLEHPNLGPHCQLVMPCVLTALDHFSPEVKRQAMRTFIHLAQNMNPTELRWYKDVILDAVARNLIGCEDLWPVAVKMAVTTVTCIAGRNPRDSWSGRIFSEMLEELARHVDDQNRRIVWLQEISPYMEALGLVLVAHFKRLLPLLLYWLQAPDDLTCILTLNKLQTVITYTWPRIPAHLKRIWKELRDTYQESRNRKASSDVQAAVVEVCKLLRSCAGPTFEAVLQQAEEDGSSDELVSVMKQMKKQTLVKTFITDDLLAFLAPLLEMVFIHLSGGLSAKGESVEAKEITIQKAKIFLRYRHNLQNFFIILVFNLVSTCVIAIELITRFLFVI